MRKEPRRKLAESWLHSGPLRAAMRHSTRRNSCLCHNPVLTMAWKEIRQMSPSRSRLGQSSPSTEHAEAQPPSPVRHSLTSHLGFVQWAGTWNQASEERVVSGSRAPRKLGQQSKAQVEKSPGEPWRLSDHLPSQMHPRSNSFDRSQRPHPGKARAVSGATPGRRAPACPTTQECVRSWGR